MGQCQCFQGARVDQRKIWEDFSCERRQCSILNKDPSIENLILFLIGGHIRENLDPWEVQIDQILKEINNAFFLGLTKPPRIFEFDFKNLLFVDQTGMLGFLAFEPGLGCENSSASYLEFDEAHTDTNYALGGDFGVDRIRASNRHREQIIHGPNRATRKALVWQKLHVHMNSSLFGLKLGTEAYDEACTPTKPRSSTSP